MGAPMTGAVRESVTLAGRAERARIARAFIGAGWGNWARYSFLLALVAMRAVNLGPGGTLVLLVGQEYRKVDERNC